MRFIYLLWIFSSMNAISQNPPKIYNKKFLKNHFKSNAEKNIIIIGESHASAVAAEIFPSIVKYLNKKNDLNNLLMELGPSEAYFYNKYLRTGNEKHLRYTIFGGSYQPWLEAWREIYKYNQKLKKPLTIIGIDFDRTRTMAYALFSIFYKYDNPPEYIRTLIEEIKTDEFYKTYTVGYPTKKDLDWMYGVKNLLKIKLLNLKMFLRLPDYETVNQIIENKATGYNDEREQGLAANAKRIIKNKADNNFLVLIGRYHAYYNPIIKNDEQQLAALLKEIPEFNLTTGAIVFEESALRVAYKNEVKKITLFELRDKYPWKDYYSIINKKAKHKLTLIPLKNELHKLNYFLDYIIVARNQPAIDIRK